MTEVKNTDQLSRFLTISDLEKLTDRNFRTIKTRLGSLEPEKIHGRKKYYDAKKALALVFGSNDAKTQYDMNSERARLAAMQADEKYLDLEEKLGNLLCAKTVKKEWSNILSSCRARLLSVPTKAAPQLVGLETPEEIEHNLRLFILEALESLAVNEYI